MGQCTFRIMDSWGHSSVCGMLAFHIQGPGSDPQYCIKLGVVVNAYNPRTDPGLAYTHHTHLTYPPTIPTIPYPPTIPTTRHTHHTLSTHHHHTHHHTSPYPPCLLSQHWHTHHNLPTLPTMPPYHAPASCLTTTTTTITTMCLVLETGHSYPWVHSEFETGTHETLTRNPPLQISKNNRKKTGRK